MEHPAFRQKKPAQQGEQRGQGLADFQLLGIGWICIGWRMTLTYPEQCEDLLHDSYVMSGVAKKLIYR